MPTDEREAHQARDWAESFGANAERYDRTRPSYPDELVDRIVAAAPGRDVVDVGCGTGIAARQFQAAGCRVLGVEVDARMAELASGRGLDVEVAKFEEWDPAGRVFDAVTAGQTWHWIDPVAGAEKAAEALRPGGLLALFWNVGQQPSDLTDAFAAVYEQVVPAMPAFRGNAADGYAAIVTKVADGLRRSGAFGEPEDWRVEWTRPYSRDEWLDVVPTHGGVNLLPPDRRGELLSGIGAAIDAVGGGFTMRYTSVTVAAFRQ